MSESNSSAGSVLPRLYWMLLGPMLLFVMFALIAKHPTWAIGWRDILFWCVVVSLGAVRWVDVRHFAGLTADGMPATRRDVGRHALIVSALAAILWTLAHSVDM